MYATFGVRIGTKGWEVKRRTVSVESCGIEKRMKLNMCQDPAIEGLAELQSH